MSTTLSTKAKLSFSKRIPFKGIQEYIVCPRWLIYFHLSLSSPYIVQSIIDRNQSSIKPSRNIIGASFTSAPYLQQSQKAMKLFMVLCAIPTIKVYSTILNFANKITGRNFAVPCFDARFCGIGHCNPRTAKAFRVRGSATFQRH